jgi:hypothetical protein
MNPDDSEPEIDEPGETERLENADWAQHPPENPEPENPEPENSEPENGSAPQPSDDQGQG